MKIFEKLFNSRKRYVNLSYSQPRTFRKVTIENAGEADRVFSMLMGDEVPPRRDFIERNATYANIDA